MQAMARISGINFANAFGATYVDSPFTRLDHAPTEQHEWRDAWENRLNLGKGEEHLGDGDYVVVDYRDYLLKRRAINEKSILRFQQCYWLHRHYPDSLEAISESLRTKFSLPPSPPERDHIVVAVHVRRGDVGVSKNAFRFTPNNTIARTIEYLHGVLEEIGVNAIFQVHSQGCASDFAEFSKIGCELYLDSDAIWTMEKLVASDILIMSKSSFSYVAALINRGVKIYEPTFNPPLSTWIVRQSDGSFDRARACDRIKEYLGVEIRNSTQDRPAPAPIMT
ncbi:hypothetical protein HYPDE_24193 [Hyphomicrobium denitrificans 1NES1]|uniref:Uncharacterized protein n=2 Tax=Hyphomicrobium denitrificans TaxID=53399 RepID=N0AZI0_9HYPH|nr:hypothetical protein HYPDE_24193 [Hyphomicrobium denitrificans 1NES1]